ncbi:MAG: Hsp70 family protein, partial [Stackebrandtia sp.]
MTYPPQGPTPPSRYPAPAPHHPVSPPPTHQTPQHPVSPPPSHMTPPPHGQPVSPLTTVPQTSPQHSPPQSAPTSGSPAPQQARPPANGYLLGVDLGTSHTVAVIRWPDGRTRPLLVDGAPVMPSAVFMDESGHIHVGRDAQRLAQTDPARFDPNPKHRIGETSVLLGDREVPVTSLLAAVLRNVASKAVEAVGHLPPAVLTCPAKWGQQRRSILEDAAARAGFPPVKLVPEPVAAAHYFTDVMRQPVPAGSSVAVFDFGGGTLDIAVVRHESDGTFAVLADGGLEDLGGLDIDAALVEYLGRTIAANAPQTWHRLTQPANGTDRRDRRLFWDDVRGAKEMLSRTTVAPVPVPGVEASLHLTRDELERL